MKHLHLSSMRNGNLGLLLILLAIFTACSSKKDIVLPTSQVASGKVPEEKDVVIQLWMEDGKAMMDVEGESSEVVDFDALLIAHFKGKANQEYVEAHYFLNADQSVPFGEYQQLLYWMSRWNINKHFLAVQTSAGESSLEINRPVSDALADRMFCEHYAGIYRPAPQLSQLELDPGPPDIYLLEIPDMNPYKRIFHPKSGDGQSIHLRIDGEGNCTQEGQPLSPEKLVQLVQSHQGRQRGSPYFLVEIADETSMQDYITILDVFRAHARKYLVTGTGEFSLLRQLYSCIEDSTSSP